MTTTSSTTSSIEERLNGTGALPWIPRPEKAKQWLEGGEGRTCYQENPIIGIAVDHFVRETEYGSNDVLILNVEGVGDVAVHCNGAVIKAEMFQARPRPGEKVGVKYTGEGQGSRGKYPIYKVVVERQPDGVFGWSDQPQTVSEFKQPENWQTEQQGSQQQNEQPAEPAAAANPVNQAPVEPAKELTSDDIPF